MGRKGKRKIKKEGFTRDVSHFCKGGRRDHQQKGGGYDEGSENKGLRKTRNTDWQKWLMQ